VSPVTANRVINNYKGGTMKTWSNRPARTARGVALVLLGSTLLTGCFDGSSSSSGSSEPELNTNLFPADGKLEATIRRTAGGVPHIKADNLKSAAFGHGYAQAQDNVCLLAEAIVKARSERSKYFGPGPDAGFGVGLNIVTDFSYKAQKIYSGAETELPTLSGESRALIEGFAEGYNRYVAETDPATFPAECRSQEWVKTITPVDLLAHYRIVGQYASGNSFATGAAFLAVPPHVSPAPTPVAAVVGASNQIEKLQKNVVDTALASAKSVQDFTDTGLASNAWGIGKTMTEQGRGALLANPHFPYTGHRRLYEVQMTVPGYINVHGAGLLGTAIPLINFNENLAWSHTVTTSRQFTWYELVLKDGDDLTYVKDGQEKPITIETYQVEVKMAGMPAPLVLERDFYFSEYGPMLAANAVDSRLPAWGSNGALNAGKAVAMTYRDANANTGGLLDTWLQMSLAKNLSEFQNVFKNCGSTLWVNTTYADDQGNAFYIDSSSVPNLSDKAAALVNLRRLQPLYAGLFDQGVTLLDGSRSIEDWVETQCGGLTTYDQKPKLLRTDWVQNSNSSHWATNPAEFLTGYSPLYGDEKAPINARTRLGIKMLQDPMDSGFSAAPLIAGQDGKFSAEELIGVIWNNRAWYAEQLLPELLERCDDIGSTLVDGRDLVTWCQALDSWDGLYNLDSVGAHIFRVFMANYLGDIDADLTKPFSPADPVGTPALPSQQGAGTPSDTMLLALSAGVGALQSQGILPTAALGTLQSYRVSGDVIPGSGGSPIFQMVGIPWHGGDGNIDGAFNAVGVYTGDVAEDTRIPRIAPTTIPKTAGLSDGSDGIDGWLMSRGTSWHFGLEFTDNGPEAYGLVSYSQSSDAMSPYFKDQSEMYSDKMYRKLPFTEDEIAASLVTNGESTINSQ